MREERERGKNHRRQKVETHQQRRAPGDAAGQKQSCLARGLIAPRARKAECDRREPERQRSPGRSGPDDLVCHHRRGEDTGKPAADDAAQTPSEHEQRNDEHEPVQQSDGAFGADRVAECLECACDEPHVARPVERLEVAVRHRSLEHPRRVGGHGAFVHRRPRAERRRCEQRERERDYEQEAGDVTPVSHHRVRARAVRHVTAPPQRTARSHPGSGAARGTHRAR